MQEPSAKLISVITKAIPYACLLAAMAALMFFFAVGRIDLAIKSLYLIIPVAVTSAMAIIKPGFFKQDSIDFLPMIRLRSASFRHLVLLSVLLYIASLCLLAVSEVRPPGYFILVGAMASLIFLEILASGEEHSFRKGIILSQIVLVAANLIFGQTLRLPLFFGWGDVLPHMNFINTIIDTGRVTPAMGGYYHFPNFHIFGAAGTLLSGMDLQTSYFIFNGLVFIISIPVVYLLVRTVTRNVHLPLIAALLYSLSREVIFGGMYMITRVMAFVFCYIILFLLIRGRTSWKLRALALFLVVPLVLIHHTTLLHFSGILLILVILELILYRPSWYIGFNYFLFFTIVYLGYWFWISDPLFKNTLTVFTSAPDLAQVSFPTPAEPLFTFFASNADAIVITFLVLIGVISLLYTKRELVTVGTAFSLFSLLAFVVYFPAITSLLSSLLLASRLQLLVAPFIAFATAGGLWLVVGKSATDMKQWKSITRISIGLCIVFFLSLSSTVIQGNTTDLNLGNLLGKESRQYFTESEVAAFLFVQEHGQDILYYGDYPSLRYVGERLAMSTGQTFDVFKPKAIGSGYMLFRKQELESRGQLAFIIWGQDGTAEQAYIYQRGEGYDLQSAWEREHKIFDSGTLYIYMIKTPG